MEKQKTTDRQSNSEQKEQCAADNHTRLQSILQGYSHKNSLVVGKKNRLVDKWNKTEGTNLSTYNFSHLIFKHEGMLDFVKGFYCIN